MWTYWICDTITGKRLMMVQLSSCTWSRRMNDGIGTGSATLNVRAKQYESFTPSVWADLLQSWGRVLVGCWNNVPVWAGLIKSPTYNVGSGVWTIPHFELGELLRRRLFFGAGTYSKTASLPFTNRSRQGMLVDVAKHVCGGGYETVPSGAAPWRLPVHFPAAGTGTWSKTFMQHEFERPWDFMGRIADEAGAPDFVFEPGFGTGDSIDGFQWVFQTAAPRLARSVHEWVISAGQTPAIAPQVTFDADGQITGVFVLGKGMGDDMLVGQAPISGGNPVPAMDSDEAEKTVDSVSQLNNLAEGELARKREPVRVWSLKANAETVLAGMHGGVNDGLRPGSRVRLLTDDDPVLGSSVTELYVVGMSGDTSTQVTLEVQPL